MCSTNVTESTNNHNTIGGRLRLARGSLSQKEFAKLFGVVTNTISRYERGERTPDADFIAQLSELMGVNPRWLILGEEPMHDKDRAVTLELQPGMKGRDLRGHTLKEISGGPEFDTRIALLEQRLKELEQELEESRKAERKANEAAIDALKSALTSVQSK